MHIRSILRKIIPVNGFIFGKEEIIYDAKTQKIEALVINVREDQRSKGKCGICGLPGSCYDHMEARLFEMVPIWNIPVKFKYSRRRINCADCGIKAEKLDWVDSECGKSPYTVFFTLFLGMWARLLPWNKVAEQFSTPWDAVRRGVQKLVEYGRLIQNLSGVTAIGVDEIAIGKGKGKNAFLTVVYQLNKGCRRLIWVGRERTEETLKGFFDWFGEKRTKGIEYVCSDMWRPYLKGIREHAINARNILDRFHVQKNLNEAVDQVRRDETKRLEAEGKNPELKKSRWCFLKRRSNLTEKQATKLATLLQMNLRTVRAYLLVEEFQHFWKYKLSGWAGKFLDDWTGKVMRSRIDPLKKKAETLRSHKELLLNWFAAKGEISGGMVEGLNNKAKTRIKMGYGYKKLETLELVLYHDLGKLPVPEIATKFFKMPQNSNMNVEQGSNKCKRVE
jgi:transposase